MSNQLLILAIIALLALFYYKNQLSEQYFYAGLIIVIILFILSTQHNPTLENFDSSDSQGREVRFGDVITLWGWTNQFLNMTTSNQVTSSARLTQPEDVPRAGWTWEFMFVEDPREVSIGINNNNNPLMYGDKIILRSTYQLGYIGINPSSDDQSVIVTNNRDEWTQLQLVSTDPSAKGGQIVKYGDQLYLKTNKTPPTYLAVRDDGVIIQSTSQDNKSLFTITDRYGQGNLIDWARRGTATQSSIYGNFLPNNAIDGNLLTFNHTQNDNNSWWQVTLPRDIYINKINITNRHDCCQDRLTNFDVMILDQNGTQIATKYYEVAGDSISWNNINQIGRIIKVQLRQKNYLHMSEVNVYGNAVNYSLLLEKPLSTDILNEPKSYSSTKALDDPTNSLIISSVDLPYNNQSKSISLTMFIKLNKTNPDETSILHKGSLDRERSPAITVLPNSSRLRMYYGTSQSSSQSFDDTDNLPLDQWIHVAYLIDGGINENTGWKLGSFQTKLQQPPFEQCCYYINPLNKQYYYLPANLAPATAKANIWDPAIIEGLTYMGQLDLNTMKPHALLYINGILRTSVELNDTPSLNSAPLNIGKSPTLNMKSSDFTIDQIKYFNYRITPQQIVKLSRLPLLNITKSLVYKIPDAKNITKFEANQLPYLENDFTVNFWLITDRPQNGTGNWDRIFLKGTQDKDRAPAMWFRPDSNSLHMPMRTLNKANEWGEGIIKSNFAFPLNEWHHVALTLNNRIQTLYIDGQQSDQSTLSDAPVYTISPLSIGGFGGQIINFQFSNYAMTQEQIQIAMGSNPDEPYNKMIRQIWKDAGCLNNPIPENQPNKFPEWKNYLKNDQKSRVEGLINDIKKRADAGDTDMQKLCYGAFTAGMLEKLSEKDKLIQYSLDQQKEGLKCLPLAPFECQQKNINDFDIRTHKDFNKYTLSSRIQKCNGAQTNIQNSPEYANLKKELDEAKLMVTQLQTLQQELAKENATLNQTIKNNIAQTQLTPDQLMQYPAFANLRNNYLAQQKNLQQITAQLQQQQALVNQMQQKLSAASQTVLNSPEYQQLLNENASCKKIVQTNLINNLDLSQLQNNPLFMQTLADIRQNSLQQCTPNQIINSPQYQALKKQGDDFNNQLMKASNLSQQTVAELENTKKIVAEILKNINNLDQNTVQKLLSGNLNDPNVQSLIQTIKNGQNGCTNIPITQHPEYNTMMQQIHDGNKIPKHVRCWGCQLPN